VLVGLFGHEVKLQDGSVVVADENYIRQSILDPQSQIVAGYQPIMPTFQGQVNEAQLMQLVSYIKSLKPPETAATASDTNQEPTSE
jgi:cytochrome c oxidase subunit 2